jgi:beta-phosphoglucomutase family hydrolase
MSAVPPPIRACLFDLDGVLTRTARLHAAAWKTMFDTFLRDRSEHGGPPFVPFDEVGDYECYVDGRPRLDGTRTFLASRGIELPEGSPSDAPGAPTVYGLSNAKNADVLRRLAAGQVEVVDGSKAFVEAVRADGRLTAVVSSSANAVAVLDAAGIRPLFDAIVDGTVARERRLPGKPAPAMFLAAADELGVTPPEAAVFEDATVGVTAGRTGGFGWVVGVGTGPHADALRAAGADVVVASLRNLLMVP